MPQLKSVVALTTEVSTNHKLNQFNNCFQIYVVTIFNLFSNFSSIPMHVTQEHGCKKDKEYMHKDGDSNECQARGRTVGRRESTPEGKVFQMLKM